MSTTIADQDYLNNKQYKDASNLNARVALHKRFSTAPLNLYRWVFDQLDISNDAAVLELGGGFGALWMENKDRIPSEWQISLTDSSEGMLNQAKENLEFLHQQISYGTVDAQSIPYPDHSFDAVIANHMLYHVPDRATAFTEIKRVLKPTGCFYATANSERNMQALKDMERELGVESVGDADIEFNMESGDLELSKWFDELETRIYHNTLVITETEPIIAYLLSGFDRVEVNSAKLESLTKLVQAMITNDGSIKIENQVGLFIAKNKQITNTQ